MRILVTITLCALFSNFASGITLSAQESSQSDADSTTQQELETKETLETESANSLLPVQYIHHDGANYIYQGNCCEEDAGGNNNHMGLIVSASKLTPQQCGSGGSTSHIPTSLSELPPAFGNGNSGIDLHIGKSNDFATKVQTFPIAEFENTAYQFSDYYGHGVLGTSVKVKDQNDKARVYSLMKMKVKVNVAGGAIALKEFPVLTISRFSPSVMQMNGNFPNLVTPILQLHQNNPYAINIADIEVPQITVVTINVPDPTAPNDPTKNKDIKCLMINRKL